MGLSLRSLEMTFDVTSRSRTGMSEGMLAVNAEMQIMFSFFVTYQTKWKEVNGHIGFIKR